MKLKTKWTWVVLLAMIPVIFCGLLLFPWGNGSLDGVHPSVAQIKRPYRGVVTEYYLDGGSIGILVVDGAGSTNMFALPVGGADGKSYQEFVPGMMWYTRTNTEPKLPLDEQTRRYFCYLIEHESQSDINQMGALLSLRGAPRDYARVLWLQLERAVGVAD